MKLFSRLLLAISTSQIKSILIQKENTNSGPSIDLGPTRSQFLKYFFGDTDIEFGSGDLLTLESQTTLGAIPQVGGIQEGRRLKEPAADPDSILHLIDGYGCWCNFQNYRSGKGLPQDFIDKKCKDLYESYECTRMDMEAKGQICFPEEEVYNSGMLYIYMTSSILHKSLGHPEKSLKQFRRMISYCKKENLDNECAARACQIEVTFLFEISPQVYLTIDEDPQGYDYSISRQNPNFDYEGICLAPVMGNIVQDLQCCGVTPFQFLWNSARNDIECCERASKTYNPVTHCCNDRSVEPCLN